MLRLLTLHEHALAEISVASISTVLGKAEFRDKFGRIFQFAALGATGFTDLAKPGCGTALHTANRTAFHVFFHISLARRSHRWLKGVFFLDRLAAAFRAAQGPVDMALEFLQVAFLEVFLLIDHYAWLKQIKLLPDPARRKARGMETVYFGIRFFFASSVVSTVHHVRKLVALHQDTERDDKWRVRRRVCIVNLLKFAMRVLETAHTSKLYPMHDSIIGVSGILSSAIDSVNQWPLEATTKGG